MRRGQRGSVTLEVLLSVQLTQELMECLKVIKGWLLDAAESVTFPVSTRL